MYLVKWSLVCHCGVLVERIDYSTDFFFFFSLLLFYNDDKKIYYYLLSNNHIYYNKSDNFLLEIP